MKYFLLRDEKNLAEISEKLYKGLTPSRRKLAEAALLKENPELKKITRARKGYLIRIPKIVAGSKADRRKVLDPFDQLANDLLDGLERFETSLEKKFATQRERHKDWASTLTAGAKTLKKHPRAGELSRALKKHLSETRTENTKKAKRIAKALSQLQKTAAEIE